MDNTKFINHAIGMVLNYYGQINKPKPEKIYTVWSCKTLQNNKALLSTNSKDTRYFEITYNGDKDEFYFDAYVKEKNVVVKF